MLTNSVASRSDEPPIDVVAVGGGTLNSNTSRSFGDDDDEVNSVDSYRSKYTSMVL